MAVHKDHTVQLGAASGIATLDSSTKVVQDPASAQTTAAASKIPISGTNSEIAAGFRPWDPDFCSGCKLTRLSATQVRIETGKCRDDSDTQNITVSSTLTVDIAAATGDGGLDTGSEAASTWYYVWVIRKSSDGTLGRLLSISSTAPTMPSGFDQKRRLGCVYNNASSNFINWRMTLLDGGRMRQYDYDESAATKQVLATGAATTFTNINLSASPNPGAMPPTSELPIINANTNNTIAANIREDGFATSNGWGVSTNSRGANRVVMQAPAQIIEYQMAAGSGSLDVYVMGFIEII